ncbi:hypothetical protein ACS0TY_017957 [Phlomoides rotata]
MLCRSSVAVSRNGNLRPENIGQNALAIIANFCFSVFVIGLMIFTIIAVTFKIQDPFFHPSSKITNFLSDNVVRIGDDYPTADQSAFAALINLTGVAFEEEEANAVSENSDCGVNDPIKCRDSDVFHLLMRAAIEKFKDVQFHRFGKPVRGENDSSCHMAWRFRAKDGDAAALKKDYRSFSLVRSENCTLSVVGIGGYHSGGNARMKRGKGKGKEKEKESTESGETGNDAVQLIESEGSFSSGKYLIYSGGGDRCKSMKQYLWSFTCMLGEAQFLNRTLVMDLSMCLSKAYSSSGVDEEGKDFRFYFDFEHLKDSASVIDQAEFWPGWKKWQQKDGLTLHLVEDVRVAPMKLVDVKDSLIMRKFGSVEPDNYWCRVCEGETESVIRRPWGMIWKSRRLLDIASSITARMKWDFDAVHVERGERVRNKKLWPNLDRDTSPKSLLATLKSKIQEGREVYIATDEEETSFFDPLKAKYSTHFLDDHMDLWDVNSDWYYETAKLNNGNAVEFDGYMRTSVDSEVFIRGKKQIETFNDLTKDCKYGTNAC